MIPIGLEMYTLIDAFPIFSWLMKFMVQFKVSNHFPNIFNLGVLKCVCEIITFPILSSICIYIYNHI